MNFFKRLFQQSHHEESVALNNRGVEFARKGNLEAAEPNFIKAIEAWPENPQPHINICNILIAKGRFDEAKEHIRLALRDNPDPRTQQDAYNNLGRVYLAQNKPKEAIVAFDKSIEVYKPDFDICYNLAVTYEGLGEWGKAIEYIEMAANYNPEPKVVARLQPLWEASYENPGFIELLKNRKSKWVCQEKLSSSSEESTFQDFVNRALDRAISPDNRPVFFAGSGISAIYPSCLPKANDILFEIFYYLFKIDEAELRKLWEKAGSDDIERFVRLKIIEQLPENVPVPFEPVFQALKDDFGHKVLRFVELLEGGHPNANHIMLAHAIHNGYTVVTTNFDRQIEKAWEDCFPGQPLKVLIRDIEFQDAIDHRQFGGLLAKIHGDMNDVNSLALTLEGITSTADQSLHIGTEGGISPEKARLQSANIHPKTFLSPPKAFFLQEVLGTGGLVVMGYSGMDKHDITPILLAENSTGTWVTFEHDGNPAAEEWAAAHDNRFILRPQSKVDQELDICLRTSRYFLSKWVNSDETPFVKKNSLQIAPFAEIFKTWVWRLRLRPGDGLAFWGRLYAQRGDWKAAETCYRQAASEYEKQLNDNESKWLSARFNLAAMRRNNVKEASTDKEILSSPGRLESVQITRELQEYLEKHNKEYIHNSLYGQVLLSLASMEGENEQPDLAGNLIEKAINIARQTDNPRLFYQSLGMMGNIHFHKKQYKEALEHYFEALKALSDVQGDYFLAYELHVKAGLCLSFLGDRFRALEFLAEAESIAAISGNKSFIDEVQGVIAFVNQRFVGKMVNTDKSGKNPHLELLDNAKMNISDKDQKSIDEIFLYMNHQKYDLCIREIDKLANRYTHKDVQILMMWLKSNIYMRTNQSEKEIAILENLKILKPGFSIILHNLGLAYLRLKQFRDAEEHLLQAVAAVEGGLYPLAHGNLALVYIGLRDKALAQKHFTIAREQGSAERVLEMIEQQMLTI